MRSYRPSWSKRPEPNGFNPVRASDGSFRLAGEDSWPATEELEVMSLSQLNLAAVFPGKALAMLELADEQGKVEI